MTEQDAAAIMIAEMDKQYITDNAVRAGIAAIAMGESQMLGHAETGYAHTANSRIREVFGSRVAGLTDAQLTTLKADDRTFFNFVYGSGNSVGRGLGNTQPDDGYNFRGRGGLQITGRSNFTLCAGDIGRPEIVDTPDLVSSDPAVGMAMSVAFIKRNYKGGGFDKMLSAVGNNTPDIEATKRNYYSQFVASGEFNYAAGQTSAVADPALAQPPAGDDPVEMQKRVQERLKELHLYAGAIDGDPGPVTRSGLQAYRSQHPGGATAAS